MRIEKFVSQFKFYLPHLDIVYEFILSKLYGKY